MGEQFEVHRSNTTVDGWAPRRPPFEPKGWLLEYALYPASLRVASTHSPCGSTGESSCPYRARCTQSWGAAP
jgi:hypothetical protein